MRNPIYHSTDAIIYLREDAAHKSATAQRTCENHYCTFTQLQFIHVYREQLKSPFTSTTADVMSLMNITSIHLNENKYK